MPSREVIVETRLQLNNPASDYITAYVTDYSKYKRIIWQEMTDKDHNKRFKSLAEYTKYLRNTYGLLGRTVNSLIFEVQGIMNAYTELKKTELDTLLIKIKKKEQKISKLTDDIDLLRYDVSKNIGMDSNLKKLHSKKQSLYYQRNKLNKMKQKANQLQYEIDNKVYNMCFGSKKEFSKQYRLTENDFKSHEGWYNHFVKQRDKNILYIGCFSESYGNQMFQMTYNPDTDDFNIMIRKENKYCKDKNNKCVILDHIDFKYRKEELKTIIKAYENKEDIKVPLTYRFHRENNKWYLQIMFSCEYDSDYESRTTSKYGTIGLDYNDGFIEVIETNESGNPVKEMRFDLKYHGTGNKAKTEIQQVISKIVTYAEQYCKDIVIENLNFKRTKALQEKSTKFKDKNYNRMLHKLDYGRYKNTLKNACFNHRVRLHLINPKNTSKVGKQKYAIPRKMTVHQSAALVIARIGQGYNDTLKKLA